MKKSILLCGLLLLTAIVSFAKIKLPVIIADSMVLQRSMAVPLWGWAGPGEKIIVSANWPRATTVSTVAGKDGKWMVKLQTPAAGGPYDVSIKGNETIVLHGVLIGEVWICSGQSNMEMPVQGWSDSPLKNSKTELAGANHPSIHLFTIKKEVAFAPAEDVTGRWAACTPASVADFSAVAYFFGRELSEKLGVPIGLINTSWGGTIAEAWTSESALRPLKDFDKGLARLDSMRTSAKQLMITDKQNEETWNRLLQDTSATYAAQNFNDNNWKKMNLPTIWESSGQPDLDGIVWFRKEITIPAAWAGKTLKLDLGPIDDYDITWFNGTPVGNTLKEGSWFVNRNYEVPASLVKEGKNIIAVRVTDITGSGGIYGDKKLLKIYPAGKPEEAISLAGDWSYTIGAIKPMAKLDYGPNQPSVLYNAMISPIIPFAIKGAIWYQGESNVERAKQYEKLFPTMIADWRTRWKEGNFPFYFVQIAPFRYWGDSTAAAALRDAQRKTLIASPNTGMVVTLDIGDVANIHPADKQEPARRLSLWALNKTYGKKELVYSGPLYKSMAVTNNRIVVSFTNTDGGLKAGNKLLAGFEIAGADMQWKHATATIQGDKVIVENEIVSKPVAVRYAWSAASTASLFNGAGLPASSFQAGTDN